MTNLTEKQLSFLDVAMRAEEISLLVSAQCEGDEAQALEGLRLLHTDMQNRVKEICAELKGQLQ